MRHLFVALVFGTVALAPQSAPSVETVLVAQNGVWWQSLTRGEKGVAVQGMIQGFDAGYSLSLAMTSRAFSQNLQTTNRERTFVRLYRAGMKDKPPFVNRSFGMMIYRIDEVYSEYPKVLKLPVSTFFVCAATIGSNCRETAALQEKTL